MSKRVFPLAIVFTFLALLGFTGLAKAEATWLTDYQAALKEAQTGNKAILVNFTGSDWCTWCLKLSKDTFSKPEFAKFAQEKLVLLEVDFPQQKEQSAAVKKQNEELQAKFGVEGFPTLLLLDKNGKEIARNVGYLAGGPVGMEAWVNDSVAKR